MLPSLLRDKQKFRIWSEGDDSPYGKVVVLKKYGQPAEAVQVDAFRFAPRGPGFRGGRFPRHARRVGEAQKEASLRREQGLRPPEVHVRERNPFQ